MFTGLLAWSKKEFSHLPWRKKRNLYRTLVSEIMLQQTTVPTVLNHFERFLKRFPTLPSLAEASEEEVCIEWKGLGYYRRARSLLAACQMINNQYGAKIPSSYEDLIKIPGIGQYTANALCAIGNNKHALPIDANLERVLSRIFLVPGIKGPQLQKKLYSLFERGSILADLHVWGARELSEALMDLGRTYCKAQKSLCEVCPMKRNCQAYREQRVMEFPQGGELLATRIVKKKMHELDLLRVVVKKGENILVYQKPEGQWLQGQWELPTFIVRGTDPTLIQYPYLELNHHQFILDLIPDLRSFKTTITKYKITNYVLELTEREFKKIFADFPFTVAYKRAPKSGQQENFSTGLFKVFALA